MKKIAQLTLLIFSLHILSTLSTIQEDHELTSVNFTNSLSFTNKVVANQLLRQLDVFSAIGPEDISLPPSSPSKPFSGLIKDDDYCNKHREYFVENPNFIFNEKHFFADEIKGHLLRKTIIPSIGKDIHKEVSFAKKKEHNYANEIKPEVNIFFTNRRMFTKMSIGKQFSCLTQISNHLPNDGKLMKIKVGEAMAEYTKDYSTKPSCFNNKKFFPPTWVLSNKEQCIEFFERFNSPDYITLKQERGIVYLRKIGGVHEGKGVFPVNDKEEIYIRKLYNNGSLCGEVDNKDLIQHFIHNPLLLEGRKFDFRVFMLIASANPTIVYYHDGYLRMSLHEYDSNSKEKGALLTNTALAKPIFKEAQKKGTYNGMTADELKDKSYWLYPQLYKYLQEQGKVNDPDWVENHLKSELKKAMVHLVRISQDTALKKSSLFELYGIDFMMDDNLDLWFIEANYNPLIQGWTPERNQFFNKMLTDCFEIVFGLLRSRTKRIINYINYLTALGGEAWIGRDSNVEIVELEKRREEFKDLSKNRFEPEFEPSPKNGFEKIVDANYVGRKRFMGLLDDECL